MFAPPGVHLLVKWTKTLQARNKAVLVKLPAIKNKVLCPVEAVKNLLQITPGSQDSPLFKIKLFGNWVPLTDSRLRKHFRTI